MASQTVMETRAMPLTISKRRYTEIKAAVEAQRAKAKAAEVASEPGAMTFQTVDQLFQHLDALVPPKDPSPPSRRKGR
jgi:hypothetical protein